MGYIAQAFLGPNALAFVQATLDSEYDGQLAEAATWADSVKYDDGWTWLVVSQLVKRVKALNLYRNPLTGASLFIS